MAPRCLSGSELQPQVEASAKLKHESPCQLVVFNVMWSCSVDVCRCKHLVVRITQKPQRLVQKFVQKLENECSDINCY